MVRALIANYSATSPRTEAEFTHNEELEAPTLQALWPKVREHAALSDRNLRRTIQRNALFNDADQCVGFRRQGWDHDMAGDAYWRITDYVFQTVQPETVTPLAIAS